MLYLQMSVYIWGKELTSNINAFWVTNEFWGLLTIKLLNINEKISEDSFITPF